MTTGFESSNVFSLDPDDPDFERQLAEKVAGTYSSGWTVLRTSATSCLAHAAVQVQEVLKQIDDLNKRKTPRGELSMLVALYWDSAVSGPALSAILLAAFCVESFLRLGFQVAIEQRRTADQRRNGIDEVSNSRILAFGDLQITKKLDELCRQLKCRRMLNADPMKKAIEELTRFRNDCVHDTPLLTLQPGVHDRARRGKERDYRVGSEIGYYQRIALDTRAARLKHALRAAQTHDDLVCYFEQEMAGSDWLGAIRQSTHNARGAVTIADELPQGCEWKKIRALSATWESVGEPQAQLEFRAAKDLIAGVTRRSKVKPVE